MTSTDKLNTGVLLIEVASKAASNSELGTLSSLVPGIGGALSGLLGTRPEGTSAVGSVAGQTIGGALGGAVALPPTAALLGLLNYGNDQSVRMHHNSGSTSLNKLQQLVRRWHGHGTVLGASTVGALGLLGLGTATGTGLARSIMKNDSKSASMTNTDKLITAVYLCETEKQAMLGKAKELGMKGLEALESAMAGGQAKTIGDKLKDIALGGKEGLRDIGNFMGRATGKKNLFGESLPHMYTGSKYQAAGHAGVLGGAGGLVGGGAAELATRGIRSHNDKLRAEGAAGAQKGMKDQVDQNGYMRNLLNAIMNKPLGQ